MSTPTDQRPRVCPRCGHRRPWWQWRLTERPDGSVQRVCTPCHRALLAHDAELDRIRRVLGPKAAPR